MRRRLVWYFGHKRCLSPDELADETLNRVARRLEEEGTIVDTQPARYCYIVAKFVFLEHLRRTDQQQSVLAAIQPPGVLLDDVRERLVECLEQCLDELNQPDRDLILGYYQGDGSARIRNRKALAARLGLTTNALSIRACRIRDALQDCVGRCRSES
jgi:DNA-directed RNA polymerase specialized sigma24 family protein